MVRLFRRFRKHLRSHRQAILGATLCLLGATAMEIIRPWPLKIIFDGILIPQDSPDAVTAWALAATGGGDALLAASALTILAIAVLVGAFGFGQSYLIASVGQRVVAAIRLQLYTHIQGLSHSFHDERQTGDLLARLTGDVRMMRDLLVDSVIFTSGRILVFFGTLAVMAAMDWRLTLAALSILPLLMLTTRKFSGQIGDAARRQRRKEGKIAEVMTESIASISVVQAYSREAFEKARFKKQNNSSTKAGLRATKLEAHLDRLVQVILAIGTCAVSWYGVSRVQAGALTPGDLLVFVAYLTTLYKPVRRLAALTGRIAKATVCGERILNILEIVPEIRDRPAAVEAPAFRGNIRFEAVDFTYVRGDQVLNNASFEIQAGETVAVIGGSGAGKSTVANLILRFYDATGGSVQIDGCDIRNYTVHSLRKQIAIVLQDTALFAANIHDNIAYGREDVSDEEIVAAARQARAHDFIMSLPDGYETVLGERGSTLSGGQRQRIAIARAIVRDAPIVILDEPMAGLDGRNEQEVRAALRALLKGRTCILITHEQRSLDVADRVLSVENGSITEIPREDALRHGEDFQAAG